MHRGSRAERRRIAPARPARRGGLGAAQAGTALLAGGAGPDAGGAGRARDRKITRLNSSHVKMSYAVFCSKKKTYPAPRYLLTHGHSYTTLTGTTQTQT